MHNIVYYNIKYKVMSQGPISDIAFWDNKMH